MSELEAVSDVVESVEDAQEAPAVVDDLSKISELMSRDAPEPAPDAESSDDEQAPPDDDAPEGELAAPDDASPDDEPELEAIDYDQIVPMTGDGEPVTIGQLKDHYQARTDFDQQRTSWEAARVITDGKHLAEKQQLQELANVVGSVDPNVRRYLQEQQNVNRQEQAAKLLEVFPEWNDPAVKRAAAPALKSAAETLGFTETEFAHIGDHRMIRALNILSGYMTREADGLAAAEKVKAELPKGQKTPRRKITAAQDLANAKKRAVNGSPGEKNAAISAIIGAVK